MVRCPCHKDRSPSLSLADGNRADLLVHCHASCPAERVLDELIQRGLLPDYRNGQPHGRRQLVTQDQVRLARTTLTIWDRDRKRGLLITSADETARKEARRLLALAKKSPPHAPIPWLIRLIEGEVRIDVGERLRGLPETRQEPLSVRWPPEIEAALLIDQGASQEVLERLVRQCLRAGARVVRVVSSGRLDVYRAEVCNA